jgi:hypothetical protein
MSHKNLKIEQSEQTGRNSDVPERYMKIQYRQAIVYLGPLQTGRNSDVPERYMKIQYRQAIIYLGPLQTGRNLDVPERYMKIQYRQQTIVYLGFHNLSVLQ